MRHLRVTVLLVLLAAGATAHAQLSSTFTMANDYDYRGASQTARDVAMQGSLDYAADSGWYVGAWGSNVDFGRDIDADLEVDLYTGYAGTIGEGLGWDVGVLYYTYPGESDLSFPEIHATLRYGIFESTLHYSNDWVNSGNGAMYLTATAAVPVARNFSLLLHAGYSFGDYFDDIDSEYFDYSAGIGYTIGNVELALKYVDTTLDPGDAWFSDDAIANTQGRTVFSISTALPRQ